MWYNEEFLAPFFLNHYSWVDKIHLIIDADTNDHTIEIAEKYPNVEIEFFKFPDMMDDFIKVNKFNHKYQTLNSADYVILVDSDEFIFCNDIAKSVHSHIEDTGLDIYFVHLWQIYEHETDFPLNPSFPVPLQRRHGDPKMIGDNMNYVKPILVKAGLDLKWIYGNHGVIVQNHELHWASYLLEKIDLTTLISLNVSTEKAEMLQGSHWRLVDLNETIKRRIDNRKLRQSQHNLATGATSQYHTITKDEIIKEYNEGKNFPIVINSSDYHAMDQYEQLMQININTTKKEFKDIARNNFEIGKKYIRLGEFKKAIRTIEKALSFDQNNIYYNRLIRELEAVQKSVSTS